MPGSAFTFLNKISAMMTKAAAPVLKGAGATFDDALMGAKAGAGVVTDDIPVKSKSFVGMMQDREIPAFKRIIAGSLKTRLWMLPAAVAINALAPGLLAPLLMIGGSILCFEGAEKVVHTIQHKLAAHKEENAHDKDDVPETMTPQEFEDDMVKGFLSTDIIMAAELTGIMLATMTALPWFLQLAALSASTATLGVGVYGLVFTLIRADNIAMHLSDKKGDDALSKTQRFVGHNMLKVIPPFMNALAVIGTGAMFIVGGELIAGHIPVIEHFAHSVSHAVGHSAGAFAGLATGLTEMTIGTGVGIVAGLGLVGAEKLAHPYLVKIGPAIAPVVNGIKSTLAPIRNLVGKRKPVLSQDMSPEAKPAVSVAPAPSAGLSESAAAPDFSTAAPKSEATGPAVRPQQDGPSAPKPGMPQ